MATTYYVHARDGSDSNDGLSIGNAFLTIGKAILSAVNGAGDTIRLQYGVGEYVMTATDITNLGARGLTLRTTGSLTNAYTHNQLAIVNLDGQNIKFNNPMTFIGIAFKDVKYFETNNSNNAQTFQYCRFDGKAGVNSYFYMDIGYNGTSFYACLFKNFEYAIQLSRASNDTSIHQYCSFVNTGQVKNPYSAAPYPILKYAYYNQPGRNISGLQDLYYTVETDGVTENIPGRGASLYAPVPEKYLIMDNDTDIYTISGGSLSLVGTAPVTDAMFSSGFDSVDAVTNTHLQGLTSAKILVLQ